MYFLLLLLLIFIVWPIVKGLYRFHRIRSQMQEQFRNIYDQARQQQQQNEPSRRKSGWSDPAPDRPKRYGKQDGEYVKYEDLAGPRPAPEPVRTSTVRETQITDVEWEEIN